VPHASDPDADGRGGPIDGYSLGGLWVGEERSEGHGLVEGDTENTTIVRDLLADSGVVLYL
jgi:hypothetical protein